VYSVVPAGTPGTGLVGILPGRDLTAHGLTSAALALLLCCVLAAGDRGALATVCLSAAVAVAYGASVELVQAFLPWRTCSLADFAVSIPGAALGSGAWLVWRRVYPAAGWTCPVGSAGDEEQSRGERP